MLDFIIKIRDMDLIYFNQDLRKKVDSIINKWIPIYLKIIPVTKLKVKNERKRKLIVSLTTIPSRIDKAWIPITCILHQTCRPDKIILWLGKDKFVDFELPKEIQNLQNKGVEIRYCDDIRAHTKYYYAMKQYKNDFIVTIDDDVYYKKRMLENLLKTYKKYPNTVCAHWIWEMRSTISGTLLPSKYFRGGEFAKADQTPSHMLFALGVGGVLYPPNCLIEETFCLDKIKELSYAADDVWLKAMEILSNIKVSKVNEKYKPDIIIEDTQKVALRDMNVGQNYNDVQLKKVFEYYFINLKQNKESNV